MSEFRDITTLDRSLPYSKIKSLDPGKQKVFFVQDGVEYDATGTACNAKQIQKHYEDLAIQAQADADAAKAAADAAKASAAERIKQAKEAGKIASETVKAAQKKAAG